MDFPIYYKSYIRIRQRDNYIEEKITLLYINFNNILFMLLTPTNHMEKYKYMHRSKLSENGLFDE